MTLVARGLTEYASAPHAQELRVSVVLLTILPGRV
jgi:hypothetical protein